MNDEKIAVALYVRNEATDIDGWISWYFAIGVDKLYIFDDESTDGTLDIIKAASNVLNIEYFSANREETPNFQLRHKKSMEKAAALAEHDNYNWIGFFDTDEFVYVSDNNLKEFLNKFKKFDGVALNWCVYGSSGMVVKPISVTPDAFRHHSNIDLQENFLVKSFIRPNKFKSEHYGGPHRFFGVDVEKYADPSGKVIEWDGPLNRNVDWSNGKVMHFINRSMEHYVERIKRRLNVDLSNSKVYFDNLEKNDIYDASPERFLNKTYEIIGIIQKEFIKNVCNDIRSSYFPSKEISFFVEKISLKTLSNQSIFYNKLSKRVVFANEKFDKIEDLIELDCFILNKNSKYIHISFPHSENIFFLNVEGDFRISSSITYRKENSENHNEFYLLSPKNNTYVEAENSFSANEGLFLIKSGNINKKETEKFKSEIKNSDFYENLSLNDFYNIIYSHGLLSERYFVSLINMLSESDKGFISSKYKGIIDKII